MSLQNDDYLVCVVEVKGLDLSGVGVIVKYKMVVAPKCIICIWFVSMKLPLIIAKEQKLGKKVGVTTCSVFGTKNDIFFPYIFYKKKIIICNYKVVF